MPGRTPESTCRLSRRLLRRVLPALLLAVALPCAARPKVGLVLGGGGARGAAHIGVLEVLEELRVPVDCVAGTSFGALVAGAWAAGIPPAQMRRAMAEANWDDMFQDNPDYTELNVRNKRLLRRFLPGSEAGVGTGGVTVPPGAVTGQKIKLFINQLVRADRGDLDIGALPLPLSIVATDIGTGERVVFREGSLTQAMRASMSVPGLMAPVAVDGRKLVDGGLVDNVPVREVRERCGAEVVIAVNVGSPLLAPQEVGSLLSVSAQVIALLTEQNVTLSLATLGADDIYLKPALEGITAGDFARHADTAERGVQAARRAADRLRTLAVDEAVWRRWQQALHDIDRRTVWVDEIRVEGLARADAAVVERYLQQGTGAPLDTARLNRDLMRVYGDGWYQSVDYTLLTSRERSVLRILPIEKPWGPDYLRLAVNLESTFNQGSSYSLRGVLQKTWINRLGGELLVGAEIGSRTSAELQWYQPVDAAHRGFVQLDLGSGWAYSDLFEDDRRISRFQVFRSAAELSAGVNLRLLGQARLGWREAVARAKVETGFEFVPTDTQHYGGAVLALDLDQLNRLHFPTDGWAAQLHYFRSRRDDYDRWSAELRGAYSFGATVFGARLAYTGSPRGTLPWYDAAALGGFLNLSGYASGQFVADTVRYGHLRAERIIGRLPLGLRGDMRLGLALELGRVSGAYTETTRTGLLDSVTLYLGGETPFGPVYVGFGHATDGSSNAYLFLGTP